MRYLITRHLSHETVGEFMTPATQFEPIRCYHKLFVCVCVCVCVKTYHICTDSLRITHDGYHQNFEWWSLFVGLKVMSYVMCS